MRAGFLFLYKTYGQLLTCISGAAGVALFVLAWAVSFNAVSRKVFGTPIAGTFEVTEALMPLIIMLPMAFTQFRRGHVRVTMLSDRCTRSTALALHLMALVAGCIFMAWVALATGGFAMRSYSIGESAWGVVRFPIWPTKFAISIGAALLSFQFLLDIVKISIFGDDAYRSEDADMEMEVARHG